MEGREENPSYQWLQKCFEDQEDFWEQLFQYHRGKLPIRSKTVLFQEYNFYHDLIIRYLGKNRIAFKWYEFPSGWRSITYEELHLLAGAKCQEWKNQELEPEQIICLILPFGLEFIICVMAALKLGLVLSCLPPNGDYFLEKRLKALGPDFIVADLSCLGRLEQFSDIILEEKEADFSADDTEAYTYPTHMPIGQFFSPIGDIPDVPRELISDEAYFFAMRDANLTFALDIQDHFAAPEFHLTQYQPGLLLSTLMSGATYLHIVKEDIEQNPELLDDLEIKTIGISPEIRDLLLKRRTTPITTWNHWFKNPAEIIQWKKWDQFVSNLGLESTLHSNVVYDASSGGGFLFSFKKKSCIDNKVLPGLATPWQLEDMNLSGQQALGDAGLYSTENRDADKTPYGKILIARQDIEYLYIGATTPKRRGRTYPTQEVLNSILILPFIEDCSIVPVNRGGETLQFDFVLIVFINPEKEKELEEHRKQWKEDIEAAIARHISIEFLPDHIKFYPIYPKIEKDELDHKWCEAQYTTGLLYRKLRQKPYKLLTKLRTLTTIEKV